MRMEKIKCDLGKWDSEAVVEAYVMNKIRSLRHLYAQNY
jgi:hypothetical protein